MCSLVVCFYENQSISFLFLLWIILIFLNVCKRSLYFGDFLIALIPHYWKLFWYLHPGEQMIPEILLGYPGTEHKNKDFPIRLKLKPFDYYTKVIKAGIFQHIFYH